MLVCLIRKARETELDSFHKHWQSLIILIRVKLQAMRTFSGHKLPLSSLKDGLNPKDIIVC